MTRSVEDEEIQILNSAEEYLIQSANIGRDISAFQNSTAGRVLMGKCMESVTEAIETLLNHDPRVNPTVCAAAYDSARRARDTLHWIWTTIAEGDAAEAQIINELPEITLDEVFNRE